ncbi:TPA: hypothetical protein N0F65_010593 [Lagenidium giganteum]|uniref:ZSWIM1/3 RNaseH-like domain-containing protein n=1 Tax=Lagenidium giganteum TaxID=4803 RepID=A0AAV2ZD47_9STRA|nr:TPA: hypothetical protein N0F65_010593 [Lagenidium giganteum]
MCWRASEATHATNQNRYKLFSFVVEDIFGHGQHVHHALIDRESIENMEDAVDHFQTQTSTWGHVKVIFNEAEALLSPKCGVTWRIHCTLTTQIIGAASRMSGRRICVLTYPISATTQTIVRYQN